MKVFVATALIAAVAVGFAPEAVHAKVAAPHEHHPVNPERTPVTPVRALVEDEDEWTTLANAPANDDYPVTDDNEYDVEDGTEGDVDAATEERAYTDDIGEAYAMEAPIEEDDGLTDLGEADEEVASDDEVSDAIPQEEAEVDDSVEDWEVTEAKEAAVSYDNAVEVDDSVEDWEVTEARENAERKLAYHPEEETEETPADEDDGLTDLGEEEVASDDDVSNAIPEGVVYEDTEAEERTNSDDIGEAYAMEAPTEEDDGLTDLGEADEEVTSDYEVSNAVPEGVVYEDDEEVASDYEVSDDVPHTEAEVDDSVEDWETTANTAVPVFGYGAVSYDNAVEVDNSVEDWEVTESTQAVVGEAPVQWSDDGVTSDYEAEPALDAEIPQGVVSEEESDDNAVAANPEVEVDDSVEDWEVTESTNTPASGHHYDHRRSLRSA
ncbi:hypothetical protein Poli38472_006783 [Pythium oligandrum]|uniref:Uncharacterized protein n=1 Tax=Pythium oligandrum TaxID=41045 RepID=A0A8K1FFG1_PYTOL|nr:hypothetical protein Poli38472_006783 [Pythium oligandrum]|eukprot:TMW56773.1 hypothetical protein Poli38472_006783 [Pythium oligandrum]